MSKLGEIVAQRRLDVEQAKRTIPLTELKHLIEKKTLTEPLNLALRVSNKPKIENARMHIAAEFKRASPSKGAIGAEDLKLEDQVETYLNAGSSIISILTEPKWFKGSLEDMEAAKLFVVKNCPNPDERPLILRKDFIVDSYQIYEARAHGADTILLIVAVLTDTELKELITECRQLGMEPLVEAANEIETKRALEAGARVLGINNRDLTTFKVDLSTTNRCAMVVEEEAKKQKEFENVSILALSGIKSRDDVIAYEHLNVVKGILVGEHLMTASNPIQEIQNLVVSTQKKKKTLIKVCGMVRVEDALQACRSKVDLIGMIFAEKSPRKLSIEEGKAISKAVRDFRETKSKIVVELPQQQKQSESSPEKRNKQLDNHDDWFIQGAVQLQKAASRGPLLIGVFMDQAVEEVNKIVTDIGLDLVQFHGKESWDSCSKCIVPVIKVIHIPATNAESTDEIIKNSVVKGEAIAILLDTTIKGGAEGGTGVTFDWSIANRYQKLGIPVFVAGGLTAQNVGEAIVQSGFPLGVDVSSGVQKNESTPREKDPKLITLFAEEVKSKM